VWFDILEPDHGTAILIGALAVTLSFLAGTRLLYLLFAMFGALVSIALLIDLNPTRLRRIIAFLDVENNKLGRRYQLWQGILGFVSGRLYGRGLGEGLGEGRQ
jgi:cell division protein FtsW